MSARRVPREAWGKETQRGSHRHAATSIPLTVAERGHNHHNDNYVGKCGYGWSEEEGKETRTGPDSSADQLPHSILR